MTTLVAAVAGVVAQTPPGSERGEEFGKTSPIALVVVLLLAVATILLIRSMSKRLKNVPASFDDPPAGDGQAGRPAHPDGGETDPDAATPPTGGRGSSDRRDGGG